MSKIDLQKMLSERQLFIPCVYDCMSAKAAEAAGYPAIFLSGGAIAYSQSGLPDMAFSTADEMINCVERICNCTDLPFMIDADDGYGESPVVVYHTVKRLIKAGAAAFTIDDTTGFRGFERMEAALADPNRPKQEHTVIGRELFLAKIKAAVAACEGSDAFVIVRTHAGVDFGMDEAIERVVRGKELGAKMSMISGVHNLEDAKYVNKFDKGWKMFPDILSVNGKPNAELDDVYKEGFNLVTFHLFEKAAMYGMMLYGTENQKNGNTVFSEMHNMNGVTPDMLASTLTMDRAKWRAMEKDFLNV